MSLFGSIGKALGKATASLDPTSSKSIVGKAVQTVGSGGLNLLPKNTIAGKIGTALAKSTHDASQVAAVSGNALAAAVGVKGAAGRLSANLSGIKRQVPVVMGAAKGFIVGGPGGAITGGALAVGQTYVAPEFTPKTLPPASAGYPYPAAPTRSGGIPAGVPTVQPEALLPGQSYPGGPWSGGAASTSGDPLVTLGLWLRRTFGG